MKKKEGKRKVNKKGLKMLLIVLGVLVVGGLLFWFQDLWLWRKFENEDFSFRYPRNWNVLKYSIREVGKTNDYKYWFYISPLTGEEVDKLENKLKQEDKNNEVEPYVLGMVKVVGESKNNPLYKEPLYNPLYTEQSAYKASNDDKYLLWVFPIVNTTYDKLASDISLKNDTQNIHYNLDSFSFYPNNNKYSIKKWYSYILSLKIIESFKTK